MLISVTRIWFGSFDVLSLVQQLTFQCLWNTNFIYYYSLSFIELTYLFKFGQVLVNYSAPKRGQRFAWCSAGGRHQWQYRNAFYRLHSPNSRWGHTYDQLTLAGRCRRWPRVIVCGKCNRPVLRWSHGDFVRSDIRCKLGKNVWNALETSQRPPATRTRAKTSKTLRKIRFLAHLIQWLVEVIPRFSFQW